MKDEDPRGECSEDAGRALHIFNLTLHEPVEEQRAAGVGPARGIEIPLRASFSDIRCRVNELFREASEERAEAVLIGGLSSVAVAAYLEATNRGLGVLEALTVRTENNETSFRHRGFRVLAEPSVQVCPARRWERWHERFASSDEPSDA